jgi:hypothetical protein
MGVIFVFEIYYREEHFRQSNATQWHCSNGLVQTTDAFIDLVLIVARRGRYV